MNIRRTLYTLLTAVAALFAADLCRAQGTSRTPAYYDAEPYYDNRPRSRMEMGVSIGASYMGISADGGTALSPRLGVRGALVMALCWSERYALQMELGYIFNKMDAEAAPAKYRVRSNVMEIPIMFSYRGLRPVRFNVGPVLSLAGTGRYDTDTERLEFGRLRTTLGFTAGVGAAVSRHLAVDLRFTGSCGRTDNYFEGHEFRSYSYWAALGLSYMF